MRPLTFIAICVAAVLSAGCAGYRLGPVNGVVAGAKTIEIVPFNNQTLQPRLGEAVTQALRERMQTDGTYRLATRGPGDIVVTGVITSYSRDGVSYLRSDIATPESYRVKITAIVTARTADKLLLDRRSVSGFTLVQSGTDLANAERQSVPLLAEDLARTITGLLTEGSW
jgi:hypothetical protein